MCRHKRLHIDRRCYFSFSIVTHCVGLTMDFLLIINMMELFAFHVVWKNKDKIKKIRENEK